MPAFDGFKTRANFQDGTLLSNFDAAPLQDALLLPRGQVAIARRNTHLFSRLEYIKTPVLWVMDNSNLPLYVLW